LRTEYASNTFGLNGQPMKQAITIRIDPDLLATARVRAREENRTLTNFLETALKQIIDLSDPPSRSSLISPDQHTERTRKAKRTSDAKP
jgi:uncharacterized protein (DUF4415 family)